MKCFNSWRKIIKGAICFTKLYAMDLMHKIPLMCILWGSVKNTLA